MSTIDSHTVWMAGRLLAAVTDHLEVVTDHLEVVAAAQKRYMENYKRHDAVTVTRHAKAKVNQARTPFLHLYKILGLGRAELEPPSVEA